LERRGRERVLTWQIFLQTDQRDNKNKPASV
jgi:hypothetical protein